MSRDSTESEKTQRTLKRYRRARGGRTLPRSGGGFHEDKKSKKINDQLEEEYDDEMRNWDIQDEEDDNYEDQDERLAWEEYKMRQAKEAKDGPMTDEEWDKYYIEWWKSSQGDKDGTTD